MESAGISAQFAAFSNDAVAGNDDRQRIASIGCSDGANGGWTTDVCSQLGVAPRCAARNFSQRVPDSLLERRSAGIKWDMVERFVGPE